MTATQEILDEFRPKIYPLNAEKMRTTIGLFGCFLPVSLAPKNHHHGHKLWFDEIMTFWEACHNAPPWEQSLMWIIEQLACHNIGYIDWEPHIPLMYTRFVRCLNLPVYYKKIHGGKPHGFETEAVAIWIVSSLVKLQISQFFTPTLKDKELINKHLNFLSFFCRETVPAVKRIWKSF